MHKTLGIKYPGVLIFSNSEITWQLAPPQNEPTTPCMATVFGTLQH